MTTQVLSPDLGEAVNFDDAAKAVAHLQHLYAEAARFLCERFTETFADGAPDATRFRAFYPEVRIRTTSFAAVDSRLSFGHVSEPGIYAATITRPDLFENYLIQQIGLLLKNHGVSVAVGPSLTPMPVHFAVANDAAINVPQ